MAALTFNKISKNQDILAMLKELDVQLGLVGYTEHGVRHALHDRTIHEGARVSLVAIGDHVLRLAGGISG